MIAGSLRAAARQMKEMRAEYQARIQNLVAQIDDLCARVAELEKKSTRRKDV